MLSRKPAGIYPILYAFFDKDDRVDRDAMRTQVGACLAAVAHGIVTLGLITEVSQLSVTERQQLVDWAIEDVAGRVPVAVTVAGRTADEQIKLARFAIDAGANWLVLHPPIDATPTGLELQRFFGRVMDTIDRPVGIQNVPELLGVGLNTDEVVQLRREHANFTVMKGEGPVVHVKAFVDALGIDVSVFNGRGGLKLSDNLAAGCVGMIPAPDCADLQILLDEACQRGETETVDGLYRKFLPYVVFAMQSIDFHIVYGKRLFAARANIPNGHFNRVANLNADQFFLNALHAWVGRFGGYLNQSAA